MESKVSLRRCVGCGQMVEKIALLRVVKTPEGAFVFDQKHKANGRGAYLCKNTACAARAKKSRGFERSFKGSVPAEIYAQLEEVIDAR